MNKKIEALLLNFKMMVKAEPRLQDDEIERFENVNYSRMCKELLRIDWGYDNYRELRNLCPTYFAVLYLYNCDKISYNQRSYPYQLFLNIFPDTNLGLESINPSTGEVSYEGKFGKAKINLASLGHAVNGSGREVYIEGRSLFGE